MKKTVLVGIAGGSASGKSFFSDKLENVLTDLKVKAIHMDNYFKPEDQRPFSAAPIKGTMYTDDNHPDTMDIPKLKQDLQEIIKQNICDVVIIEGLLTLWDKEIADQLDLKLYVDCKDDERIVRRLRRNMAWGLSFDQISNVYLDMVRFRHHEYVEPSKWNADLILNGSIPSDRALKMISTYIKNLCCEN